jgi:ceramide glucosyltransferase
MTEFTIALVLILAWAYLIGSTVAALRFARRRIAASAAQSPVSMLKPLHGAEPGLYENLRSFADQDYPQAQVVLGVRHSTTRHCRSPGP